MLRVTEIITEPDKIFINDSFKLKIKIESKYLLQQNIATENNIILISENNENIVTEWGTLIYE